MFTANKNIFIVLKVGIFAIVNNGLSVISRFVKNEMEKVGIPYAN